MRNNDWITFRTLKISLVTFIYYMLECQYWDAVDLNEILQIKKEKFKTVELLKMELSECIDTDLRYLKDFIPSNDCEIFLH